MQRRSQPQRPSRNLYHLIDVDLYASSPPTYQQNRAGSIGSPQSQRTRSSVKPPQRTTKTAQKLVVFPSSQQPPLPASAGPSTAPDSVLQPNLRTPPQVPTQSPPAPATPSGDFDPSSAIAPPNLWEWTLDGPAPSPPHPPQREPSGPLTDHSPQQQQQQQQQQGQTDAYDGLGRTDAERMPKNRRTDLPRMTCYCAADAYDLAAVSGFLTKRHMVDPQLYDECLYVVYEHGRNVGTGTGARRRRRIAKGGSLGSVAGATAMRVPQPIGHQQQLHHVARRPSATQQQPVSPMIATSPSGTRASSPMMQEQSLRRRSNVGLDEENSGLRSVRFSSASLFEVGRAALNGSSYGLAETPKWMGRNEVFVFEYGVIVLWNFSEEEELSFLSTLKAFATNPRVLGDIEVEDFHFQYDLVNPDQPRIFNDMITLKSGNPLVKLTISHGVAQSAKLAHFENIMDEEIESSTRLPKMMAKYGEVKLRREDVVKVVGRLFRLRVNVNLISNVLDTPELFWSEPELEGLYNAIRGYLEISQRVKLLNSRADVIGDTLAMLTEHLNGSEMTFITWVIIILIIVTSSIAAAEIYVKVLMTNAGMEK